jgi:hypothetical protein
MIFQQQSVISLLYNPYVVTEVVSNAALLGKNYCVEQRDH